MSDDYQDEIAKRLSQGQEAQRLLQNPLIEGFFDNHYKLCYKAFCELPMGCLLENYQTVQHDYLALKRLRGSLEAYIQRAEMDVLDRKIQDDLPEDIEV